MCGLYCNAVPTAHIKTLTGGTLLTGGLICEVLIPSTGCTLTYPTWKITPIGAIRASIILMIFSVVRDALRLTAYT